MKKVLFYIFCACILCEHHYAFAAERSGRIANKSSARAGTTKRSGKSSTAAAKKRTSARGGVFRTNPNIGIGGNIDQDSIPNFGTPNNDQTLELAREEWKSYIRKYRNWCEEDNGGKFNEEAASKAIADLKLETRLCELPVVYVCPEGMNSQTGWGLGLLGVGVAGGVAAGVAHGVEQTEKGKLSTQKSDFNTNYAEFVKKYTEYKETGCFN